MTAMNINKNADKEIGNDDGLKKNLLISTLYQALALILPLITAPYVFRVLGVNNIGIFSYTHSYAEFFMLFGALGTISYGSREISMHRQDVKARSQLFWEIESLTIITTLFTIVIWAIGTVLFAANKMIFAIWSIALLGTLFDISWFYAGIEKFKHTIVQNLICKFLGMLSIFLFVRKSDDLWKYVLIIALTQTVSNVSMWIYLPRYICRISFRSMRLSKHFKETLVYFIPTIAISIYTILDRVLIGLITHDTYENGNYESATKIINISKTLAFVGVNMVMQSRISFLFAQKKYDEIKEKIKTSFNYMAFASVGLAFGLVGVAKHFIPLYYGSGYDKTIMLLQIMAPIVFIVSISNCLGSQYYNPSGLRAKSAKFIITGSLLNLVLNLLLIPRFKSEGAVVASIIAELVISYLYVKNCDGYITYRGIIGLYWKKIIAGLIMLVVIVFEGDIIKGHWLAVICEFLSGVCIYAIVLLLLRDSLIVQLVIPQIKQWVTKRRTKRA